MSVGQIIRALSGYYDVLEEQTGTEWRCRARGVFKNRNIHPLVGDYVTFVKEEKQHSGTVTEIKPRKNELNRPPVANVDQALLVFSIEEPRISHVLLDRMLVHVEQENIEPVICFSKSDLPTDSGVFKSLMQTYERAGYQVKQISIETLQGLEEMTQFLANKITVFAGQSGVGKTTLLNALSPGLHYETQAISAKLGRGKHTTRHVELVPLPLGGHVVDTPGFSQLEFSGIDVHDLGYLFRDFRPYLGQCKFRGCLHEKEPRCAVKSALEEGVIMQSRYENYIRFIHEIQEQEPKY